MTPADPDTMLTAIVEAQKFTKLSVHKFTVFTDDQQLYKATMNVMCVYPKRLSWVCATAGVIHIMMTFVVCVGVLIADNRGEDVLKSSFGSLIQMLTGHHFL